MRPGAAWKIALAASLPIRQANPCNNQSMNPWPVWCEVMAGCDPLGNWVRGRVFIDVARLSFWFGKDCKGAQRHGRQSKPIGRGRNQLVIRVLGRAFGGFTALVGQHCGYPMSE